MKKSEQAVENHKNRYTCSGAVLCAFAEDAGISEDKAVELSRPMAGGRMIKCGAVLAAEQVLKEKYGDESGSLIDEFERRFIEKNGSAVCKELKGIETGKMLRSCRGCVTDAAEILEQMLEDS